MGGFSLIGKKFFPVVACLAIAGMLYAPLQAGALNCPDGTIENSTDGQCEDASGAAVDALPDVSEDDQASAQTDAAVQNAVSSGVQKAVKNCTGASGAVSNALGSIVKSTGLGSAGSSLLKSATSGIGDGGVVGSAINKATGVAGQVLDNAVNTTVKSAVSGAGSAADSAAGSAGSGISGAIGSAKSAIVGATDSIVSGVGSFIGSGFQSLGVSFGSQGIADLGNSINSFTGEGLSGILSSFGSVGSMLGPVSSILGGLGGGGPIPVADSIVRETTTAIKKKETCDDVLASAVSRNIAWPKAISEAANWVNTGNSGNPFYPKNIADEYTTVSKEQTNILIDQIRGSNSPIAKSLIPSVVKSEQNKNSDNFAKKIEPTLDKVAGSKEKAEQFASGSNPDACSGYLRCLTSLAEPNNNWIGVKTTVDEELSRRQTEAKDKLDKELANNQGFLNNKKCVDLRKSDETGDLYCMRWETISPGIVIAATAQKVAVTKIEAAATGNADGQNLAPILDGIGNQILTGGLSELSRTGFGIAASISPYNRAINNQISSALSDALGTANTYASVLSDGIAVLQKIIADLNDTSACYAAVDGLLAASAASDGNGQPQTQSKPALEEINTNLPNFYLPGLSDYQYKSFVLAKNPQMTASDADVNAIVAQVNTLQGRQTSIAGYLASCNAQKKALDVAAQNRSGGSNN